MLQNKILETLILNADDRGFVIEPLAVVRRAFPTKSEPDILSILASLKSAGLVSYHLSPQREVIMFEIAPAARAFLIAVKEEREQVQRDKWKDRIISFVLGFIADALIALLLS